jgi:hypothetical protein
MEKNEDGKWAQGSVRISSDILSPDDISALIRLQPTRTRRKGEPFMPKRPRSAIVEINMWVLESGLGSEYSIPSHLDVCLRRLEERVAELSEITKVADIDVFLGFSSENGQGGVTLGREFLTRLWKLPVSLTLDLYPPASEYGPWRTLG